MSDVDDRVVNMRFNNSAFERGARTTIGTIDKLKQSLNFSNSKKSMDDLQASANRFHMGNMGVSIEGISGKLLALGTIGVTALANITNRAITAGTTMVKSLTVQPLLDGLREYETQLNSVQTILANTQSEHTNIDDVNRALNVLNTYSDKTIYNFGQMARNIGTFTSAGVKLDTSVNAIKGIANVAALSGSNADQASTAMYQLSQAIANNKVGLQDWNSVVNAGMGGKVFQEALFNMGKLKGTLKGVDADMTFEQWTKAGNSFRNSLQEGWITGEVLTSTLSTFTGDLTDAQLKAMGYTDAQIKQVQKQAKVAQDAATKVKTFTQLMGTMKEAVGSGWSQSFQLIFGNFEEARSLWTGISKDVGKVISSSAKARNKILKDWKELGGRRTLILSIKHAFADLGEVLTPIKKAFRDIFPAKTGKDLYDLTLRFYEFTKRMRLSEDTMTNLRRTFRGIFAVFSILGKVVGGVIDVFKNLVKATGFGGGGILDFTAKIGDFLVSINDALERGDSLTDFFDGIGAVLAVPIRLFGILKDTLVGLFDGFNTDDAHVISDGLSGIGSSFAGISDTISNAWDRVVAVFTGVKEKLQPIFDAIGNLFTGMNDTVAGSMSAPNFDSLVRVFNTVFLGGIALALRKFLSGGINIDLGGGFLRSLSGAFGEITGTMKAMQTQLKAKALLEIAGALALITASVVALSMIKPNKLEMAVKALAILFGELLLAMDIMSKIGSGVGFVKMPVLAASMILLAGAVLLLVAALKQLAKLDMEEIKKGLVAIGVLLAELAGAVTIISMTSGNMARTAAGLIGLAVAVKILASAVKDFAVMSWKDILKGLTGVAGVLIAIAAAVRLMPKGMVATGTGILAISVAVNLLALAVKSFSSLDWQTMGRGLAGMAAALVAIAGAMHLMPKGMVAQAAALVLIGLALQEIASAIRSMGNIDWKTMGKGLLGIGAALAILVVALNSMKGTIRGSLAMGIAAASLSLMAGALKTLGNMSLKQIGKGLLAMAGALGVLGLSARLLAPATPAIAALGFALLGFAAAVALAGVGILAIGTGLAAIAKAGSGAVATLLTALDGFIERIPAMAEALAQGFVNFVIIIGENAPKMIAAFSNVLTALMQAIIDNLPKALELFTKLISTFLTAITTNSPKIIAAGLKLVVDVLNGIADKMPEIISAGARVVISFLDGLGSKIADIIDAGLRFIVKFLHGIADGIRNHMDEILAAGADIGKAILQGLWNGITGLIGWLWHKFTGWLSGLWDDILGWFGISSPSTKAAEIGKAIVKGIWEGIKGLINWLWDQVTGWIGDLWGWIEDAVGEIVDFFDLGDIQTKDMIDKVNKDAVDAGFIPDPKTKNPTQNPRSGSNSGGGGFGHNVSIAGANAIASNQPSNNQAKDEPAAPTVKDITFIQNNNSPKELSSVDIYRGTRSQLALAKEALSD